MCVYYSSTRGIWSGSFRTPNLQYSSTVLTIGASLQHHTHVLQYTPHRTVILVPLYLYRIVCMYTLHAAIQYRLYHVHYDDSTLSRSHPSRCHIGSFCELHIDHLLPQTSFSSFFLSLSASHSTPVSLRLIPGEFEHCCLACHSC